MRGLMGFARMTFTLHCDGEYVVCENSCHPFTTDTYQLRLAEPEAAVYLRRLYRNQENMK